MSSFAPETINPFLESIDSSAIKEKYTAHKILLRPNVNITQLSAFSTEIEQGLENVPRETIEQAEIYMKYESYIQKEIELASKAAALEDLIIPDSFDYEKITSLSNESKQKFIKIKPKTIGQASRISGVNPTDIQILMVFMQ